jgi:hypothetical protein
MTIRVRRSFSQFLGRTLGMAFALALGASTSACNGIVETGQQTAGTNTGGTASGGGTTGGTTGGQTTGGTSTGSAAIGRPSISAPGATIPNPCEVDIDFGNVLIGMVDNINVSVNNTGTGVLDLSPIDPTLDPEFSVTYPTPAPIQPAGFDQFSVSFSPYKVGQVTSSFTIQTDGVNAACPGGLSASLTITLTGNGMEQGLLVTPNMLDFGNTLINTTSKKSVVLSNQSAIQITGIGATVSGADSNFFVVDNAPSSLGANDSAMVDISYSPLTLETRSLASVVFNGSGGQMTTLSLFGEPVGVALTLAPNPVSCGFVPLGSTAICCTTVANQSNVVVSINSTADFENADGAFALSKTDNAMPPNSTALPVTIQPGSGAEVCFVFTPTASQSYNGQVTLTTTDPSGSNPIVALMGWGGGPQITCSPLSVAFGSIADFETSTVAVICSNTGTALPGITLMLGPLDAGTSVFSAAFDPTVDPYPPAGLNPGGTAQIDVTYAPIAASNDVGSLIIPNNGGQGRTLDIPLSGSGQP